MENKKNLTFIGIILMVAVCFWIVNTNDNESLNKVIKTIEYKKYDGVVIKKFIDSKNHNEPIIILSNNKKVSEWEIYDQIQIGDSLSKKRNSKKLKIYRGKKVSEIDLTQIVIKRKEKLKK